MKTPTIAFYQDKVYSHRWTLKHGNGKILAASSEGFKSTSNAKRNFRAVRDAMAKVILATALMLGLTANAQTNAPITATQASTNSSGSFLTDVKKVGVDAWDALKGANFKSGITVEPFGLYHKGDFGGGLAVTTANTNGLNAGFALAAINNSKSKKFDFYDATLSLSLGKMFTVPIINHPAYAYLEAGPSANLAHPTTILEQSIAGVKMFFFKNKLTIGAGVGQNSEWTDPFYIFHSSWTF